MKEFYIKVANAFVKLAFFVVKLRKTITYPKHEILCHFTADCLVVKFEVLLGV